MKKGKVDAYLRPIEGLSEPKDVLVYDIESKQGDTQHPGFSRAFLLGFYDGKFYKPFRNDPCVDKLPWYERANAQGGCVDKFMREVLRIDAVQYQSKTSKFYAHNGGRFDSTFLLTWLVEHTDEFSHEIISVQGRAQSIEVWPKHEKRSKISWVFTDSALLLQMPLAKAGKIFCPEMPKMVEFSLFTHECHKSWEIYNKRDCETLYHAMYKFRDMVYRMNGALGMTAPATAMQTFRRGFQQEPIKRNAHTKTCKSKVCDGCMQEWVIRGYHGGRTEIFKSYAKENLFYYDINSSYAASMLEPMPVGDMKEFSGDFRTTSNFLDKMLRKYIGMVECTVHIPKTCHIPPLPYVWKKSKAIQKLIFPVGTFSGIWNWEELELLSHPLVGGEIIDIKKSVWFQKKRVFNEFIETLYKLRDKNSPDYDIALSELAKLLMNSLYGKFGMKRDREMLVSLDTGDPWPKNHDGTWGRPIDGDHDYCKIWVVKNRIDAPYIIPQVSQHITSLSRKRLWLGMAEVMGNGGDVFYSDTDSIMSDREMREGSKLGEWKREFPGALLNGVFILPKLYALINASGRPYVMKKDEKEVSIEPWDAVAVKMKGVGRAAQTLTNFKKIISGGEVGFSRVEQHRTILRKKLHGPIEVDVAKKLRTNYEKRIFTKDNVTRAICVGEDIIE